MFVNGIFPSMWKKSIICPVPKSSMPDVQDPKCYRGITLAVSSYTLFCSDLNSRLMPVSHNASDVYSMSFKA